MKINFKWGIIGTGGIAGKFANDLGYLNNHTLAAVGSHKLSTAQQFVSKYPDCVGLKLIESPLMPHAESIGVIR